MKFGYFDDPAKEYVITPAGLPSRIPYSIAIFNIIIASAFIGWHIVITVTCKA